ncbi:hypothetical protein ACH4E7_30990 [Kitasatospora sp. NPDC018058]
MNHFAKSGPRARHAPQHSRGPTDEDRGRRGTAAGQALGSRPQRHPRLP